jgi:hypothetical protein
MLTLKRFAALAASYGGDLRRWPEDARGEAQALAKTSSQARDILADAQKLDAALDAAGTHEDRLLLSGDEQAAALARLRAGVAARIATAEAAPISAAAANRRSGWMSAMTLRFMTLRFMTLRFMALRFAGWPRLGWAAGMATVGCLAILAGLWLGGIAATSSATDTVLTLLQPAPPSIQILAD